MAIRFSGGIQLPQGRLEFKVPVAAPPAQGLTLPQSSNVLFHIDASVSSSVTLSGSNITQIDDLGPGGRDFIGNVVTLKFGGAASTFPVIQTASQNDRDTMLFDGERSILKWTGSSITVKHAFAVCKYATDVFTNFDGMLTTGDIDNLIVFTSRSSGTRWYSGSGAEMDFNTYFRNTTNVGAPPESAPINQFAVHSISDADGIAASEWVIGHDREIDTRGWDGEIAHIIAYDIVLSSSDRNTVIADLIDRWGIV